MKPHALSVLAALLVLPFSPAQASPPDEAPTKHAASVDGSSHKVVRMSIKGSGGGALSPVFHDAEGKVIDAEAFEKAMAAGRHFNMTGMNEDGKPILALLPKGSSSGRSLTPSNKKGGLGGDLNLARGQALPAFELSTVAGPKASAEKLLGKPTLLDFYFAECVGCIIELPALNAYAKQHPELNYLAITFDDAATAKDFVSERSFSWPVAYEGMSLINKLGVNMYPTMLLLDADGKLLASHVGSIPSTSVKSSDGSDAQRDGFSENETQRKWLENWVNQNLPAGSG